MHKYTLLLIFILIFPIMIYADDYVVIAELFSGLT